MPVSQTHNTFFDAFFLIQMAIALAQNHPTEINFQSPKSYLQNMSSLGTISRVNLTIIQHSNVNNDHSCLVKKGVFEETGMLSYRQCSIQGFAFTTAGGKRSQKFLAADTTFLS